MMLMRGKGWIPQIIASDRRVRARKDFAILASALAARDIDVNASIFLDGDFVSTGGSKHEFLLILPDGKWVWATLKGEQFSHWFEDVRDEYSEEFQAELKKVPRNGQPDEHES